MSSVNKIEIEKFSNMADEWWDPHGKFKPLHKFNPIRIKYIKENIIRQFKIKNKNKPLSGINILDIGCGGGLLSEPMCRLGANVTGIDASTKNVKISKLHAKKDNLKINYICSSPEKLKISKKFDVILNMEIVEHVEDISFFLKSCSKLLNKNGLMFRNGKMSFILIYLVYLFISFIHLNGKYNQIWCVKEVTQKNII